MKVPRFETIQQYAACFNDATYWRPFVEAVCARHGLTPAQHIEAGLAGTFPTFIVDRRWVIKLFGRQFEGPRRFEVERSVYRMLAGAPHIAAPRLLHAGQLFPDQPQWSWPYLISSALPGRSLGLEHASISRAELEAVVVWLGGQLRAMYELRLPPDGELAAGWAWFEAFLQRRRSGCVEQHRTWGSLPPHLLEQAAAYVLPAEQLIPGSRRPCLVHGDMNEDHVLGRRVAGHWRPSGMIDFGDALAGDPLYDLVAFHIGLAHCDKQLLRSFLAASGLGGQPLFVERAMSYTLLFEFDVLSQVFAEFPAARELPSLAELAAGMWDLEQPGLDALPHDDR